MASRRLASSLNGALRSRAALQAVRPAKRGFATPVSTAATTQSTTLSNGLTVNRDRVFSVGSDINSRSLDRRW
ncbi:mitochondrial processing peptidase beta subunit [Coccidioides immitis RMSCC 3703]|uniref:Mitochondrial processing peptidase beta subunit n=1 Tax=Coccidioides immitis RMSCC 3703 TaxID=454286 RepID=A0A0J8QIG3_COCIT|nr:mitochondrial processing peptidase beta subunit [Coccidioides immitis RMSCC 3703]